MTPGQVSNVLLALQELARAQRMQERNHPEQAAESVKAARAEVAQIGEQGRAVTQFKALVAATDDARKRFEAADQAVENYRRTLGSTEAPTTAQVQNLQRLQQAVLTSSPDFSQFSPPLHYFDAAAAGELEGVADRPLDTHPGVHRALRRHFVEGALAEEAARATMALASAAAAETIAQFANRINAIKTGTKNYGPD